MLAKKCPKCSAVWYTALPKCAFCGIEGIEVPTSTHTGRLPEKPVPAVQLETTKVESSTAVAEATPLPPTSPGVAAKAADEKPAVASETEPAPEKKKAFWEDGKAAPLPAPVLETKPAPAPAMEASPAPSLVPLPPELKRPNPSTLPPAPRVPSSKVPVVFALLGLAAAILLPVAMFVQMNRSLTILAYLVGAVLLPYAPIAWLTGRRYEERCIDLGFKPASSGRAGRLLGTMVTIVLALEGTLTALLAALARISAGK